MDNDKAIKYTSMGLEWVQMGEGREALFAFIMVEEKHKLPRIDAHACTVPDISGDGAPNEALYAIRSSVASVNKLKCTKMTAPSKISDVARIPSLKVLSPKQDANMAVDTNVAEEMLEAIPSRGTRGNDLS